MTINVSKNALRNSCWMLFLSTVLFSCDVALESSSDQNHSFIFKQVYENYEEPGCQSENCATVGIKKVTIEDSHRLNQYIDDLIKESISTFTKTESSQNVNEAIDAFFSDFKEFKEAFPESRTPWEIQITMTVDWMIQSNGWLSIRTETYSYTGGAHPNYEVQFNNLGTSGKKVTTRDWLKDQSQLEKIAEQYFREEKGILATQTLNDAGYEFVNGFELPENMGFGKGYLILMYNAYEIGSYADGPTEIKIPISELKGIIAD